MALKIAVTSIATGILFTYREEIKELLSDVINICINKITSALYIKKIGNEKIVYVIMQHLERKYVPTVSELDVRQANNTINYKLRNGTYNLWFNNARIYFKITDNYVVMWCFFNQTKLLQDYLIINCIENNTNCNNEVLFYYLSNGNEWNIPLIRRVRNITPITADMRVMLDNVTLFYRSEEYYKNHGWAYRKGYFIEGESGTGKSSIIELLANEHKMCIYLVNLNSANMSDANLINLVGQVPLKSLIVFDEFDKQYVAIQSNTNIHISIGGILNAIDGSQRLSHGTIVVVIVNNKGLIPETFLHHLLRNGRLDVMYNFR